MKKEPAKLSRLLFLMIVLAFTTIFLPAQVAINTDGTDPDGSAMLDVKSSDKGLLIPRLTTAKRNTLAATAVAGLMVYDTDLDKFFFFNGAIWEEGSAGNLWTKGGSYTYLTNTSDNVGIGTSTPARKLEVNGGSNAIPLRLSSTSVGARLEFLSTSTTDWAVGTWGNALRFLSSTNEFGSVIDQYYMDVAVFRPWSNNSKTLGTSSARWSNLYSVAGNFSGDLNVTGNTTITGITSISDTTSILGVVSIGTTSPMGQLHVHDPGSHATIYLTPATVNDTSSLFLGEDPDGTYGMYWKYNGGINEMELWGKQQSNHYGPHLRVTRNTGNIAIGGDFAVGYKLSVSGDIICEELRVNLIADWPDYVFERGYDLMPIRELSKYVDKNGHLPNVPPAEEIEKSGIAVGEMQRLMMEKIEELSLYIIEQQQQIDELKVQINK